MILQNVYLHLVISNFYAKNKNKKNLHIFKQNIYEKKGNISRKNITIIMTTTLTKETYNQI